MASKKNIINFVRQAIDLVLGNMLGEYTEHDIEYRLNISKNAMSDEDIWNLYKEVCWNER